MTDRKTLEALLKRVEEAGGEDAALEDALHEWQYGPGTALRDSWPAFTPANYTSSIDAALAFVERVLPEANCCGIEKDPHGWTGYVSRNRVKSGHWHQEAEAPTAPLALLRVLLKALIAQTESAQERT